jgi:hypothetical protein
MKLQLPKTLVLLAMQVVLFRPGLRPGAEPSRAEIGRAKPGRDNGSTVALARPALLKSQSQAVKPGLFGVHI